MFVTLVYKAYKFRMYPTKDQQSKLNSFLGASRFIYNYFLNQKEQKYKKFNINYTLKDMKKDLIPLQEEYQWLKDIDSCILRTSLENLDNSYNNFFKLSMGYPKYKSRNKGNSYHTNCIRSIYKGNDYSNIKVDLNNKTIKLPKINEITIKGYRNLTNFDKRIINATVSKEANKYYVSLCVEEEIDINEFHLRNAIGIDLGIKNSVITSDGIKYDKMSFYTKLAHKLKGLNKWLSRSQKGSNNRHKIIIKIQRVYQKLKNMRKYFIHNITNEIVKNNDLIITENLKIQKMIQKGNKYINKGILNTSLSEIIRQLEYKCKWLNKRLIKVDTYFPSSQYCNVCGKINKNVKDLSIRKWICKDCNNENDRDINASINILEEGIRKYYQEQMNF